MVEIHDMRYKLCGGNVHLASDKYVDSLKGFIREQHFHEVFPDGAGCADDQCFHQIVSWGFTGSSGEFTENPPEAQIIPPESPFPDCMRFLLPFWHISHCGLDCVRVGRAEEGLPPAEQ